MSEVTRYDDGSGGLYEYDEGMYVAYDDYEETLSRLEKVTRERDIYKTKIDGMEIYVQALERKENMLLSRLERVREALKPFTHPDLNKEQGGQPALNSIIFQRGEAILTRGDCFKAREAFNDSPVEGE